MSDNVRYHSDVPSLARLRCFVHPCTKLAGLLRKSLRNIALKLQVHLTLSALQASAYIMSDICNIYILYVKCIVYGGMIFYRYMGHIAEV